MKKFRKYLTEDLLSENLLSKAYALAQNSQHNAASQKVASNASKIVSILRDAKARDDADEKIERLLDAMIEMTELFKNQSQQSSNIKNTVVAAALFADDIKRTLEKYFDRKK
jgi:hypothetical protein